MDNKFKSSYKIKQHSQGLKDISLDTRQVALYLAAFNNIDSDFDILQKGCFKKSIQERGVENASNRKIAFLRYHNWEMPIGKFIRLEEDNHGLFAVAQLSKSTNGNDALLDYQDGIIREHSIGFKYIQDKITTIEDKTIDGGKIHKIHELCLWEGSAVTFGANEMTPVLQVSKGLDRKNAYEILNEKIDTIVKSIINGKGTDERLYELEMNYKLYSNQLKDLIEYDSLIKTEKIIEKSVESQIKIQNEINWSNVINSLK